MNNDKVKAAVKEMVDSMFRVQSEKDLQKDIVDRMHEEEDMVKAEFRKMAKFAYNMELETKIAELEAIKTRLNEIGYE